MLSFEPTAHRYTWDARPIPSVTQALRALFDFSSIPPAVLERKAAIGRAVHRAIELEIAGTLDRTSIDAACVPYFDAWRRFRDECRFEPALIEFRVTNDELGEPMRYAGTIDEYGMLNGSPALIDWKTAMLTNAPAVGSQLAAYLKALHRMGIASLSDRRFAVKLGADGRYKLERFRALDTDWQRFVLQLRATLMLQEVTA